jgi:hypothetical protein
VTEASAAATSFWRHEVKERHAVASPQAYSEKEKEKKKKPGKEKNVALQPVGKERRHQDLTR